MVEWNLAISQVGNKLIAFREFVMNQSARACGYKNDNVV